MSHPPPHLLPFCSSWGGRRQGTCCRQPAHLNQPLQWQTVQSGSANIRHAPQMYLNCTALSCNGTVLHCTALCVSHRLRNRGLLTKLQAYTVLYCIVLYCTVLDCTVLYCTVLDCSGLFWTALYCCIQIVNRRAADKAAGNSCPHPGGIGSTLSTVCRQVLQTTTESLLPYLLPPIAHLLCQEVLYIPFETAPNLSTWDPKP
jgi:hypothetical protein